MLFRYKKSCEKIAMGMLAFMPEERDIKKLRKTMQVYQENPKWQLFLWKEGDDFVGLIGVEVADDHFTVHHLSLCPSFRREGIGHRMVYKLQEILQPLEMRGTRETQRFLDKCSNKPTDTEASYRPSTKYIS
ncbi:GNAT family N-acetyltransferase [Planomicrobium sp. CPCC 101110]|uniref:GNAT family N-acetyltransferase n=1 Tax=Planomicrobium sp. CPCC 101110 TaxID=2599619 RepID=UPI0011B655E1|nr:GNAT family N-acetyltransferase [Planomicrobium sp. CPCC 101110]TWT27160.1 GNAT family N-acetyltransferase [Planomicrobium sp. CPCC 101110]